MHLFAALLPPADALEGVRALVAEAATAPPPESGPPGRHRLGRRRDKTEQAQPGPLLDVLPTPAVNLTMAKFGNLPLSEATRLADTMEKQAAGWEAPRLRLAGGAVLEPEGDDSVWVGMAGDMAALGAISAGVRRVAQGLQLFVDRRAFRPQLQIAKINPQTTEACLEEVLALLQQFESPSWWQTTLSLLIPADLGPGQPPFKNFRDIPLGPAVEH